MRIKLVSDAHANYPALRKAIEAEDNEDMIIYLGDIVGLLGFPSETVNILQEQADIVLKGNHDIAVLEKGEGHVGSLKLSEFEHDYIHRVLDEDQKEWIKNKKTLMELDNPADTLISHAYPTRTKSDGLKKKPHERTGASYRDSESRDGSSFSSSFLPSSKSKKYEYMGGEGVMPDDFVSVASKFKDKCKFLYTGHTHIQHHLNAEQYGHDILVVNPGSIGQPKKGNRKMTYSIVDTENKNVEEKSVSIDKNKIKEKLKSENAPMPDKLIP